MSNGSASILEPKPGTAAGETASMDVSGIDVSRMTAASAEDNHPTRRGFRFKITAEGLMLILIVLLVGFAAWHSGANLLYLLFSILVSVYLLHGFLLSINLQRLEADEEIPALAVAGQPFGITLRLTNRKRWLSSLSIVVSHRDIGKNVVGGAHFFQIPAKTTRELSYQAVSFQRGFFPIKQLVIASRYPFGFEERSQIIGRDKKVLVLPQTFPVSTAALQVATGFGDQESLVKGTGTDLYGLREYVEGEPARHVHWRTSARAQKMMVAEFTREERRRVVLMLDNGIPGLGRNPADPANRALAERFENAVLMTASLARLLIEGGFDVGLISQDGIIHAGQGTQHLTRILSQLALIQLRNAEPMKPLPNVAYIVYRPDFQHDSAATGVIVDSRRWAPMSSDMTTGENA